MKINNILLDKKTEFYKAYIYHLVKTNLESIFKENYPQNIEDLLTIELNCTLKKENCKITLKSSSHLLLSWLKPEFPFLEEELLLRINKEKEVLKDIKLNSKLEAKIV